MNRDPIIDEVRSAGREMEKEAGGDTHRFFKNLRAARKAYKNRIVRPRRRPGPPK